MPDEWVAAKPDDLWFKRRVRLKSERVEGYVAGPLTAMGDRCPIKIQGAVGTWYTYLWNIQVRKGRN